MSHPLVMLHDAPQPDECGVVRRWIDRIPVWLPMMVVWIPVALWFVKRLDDGSDEPLGLLALACALALAWRDRASFHLHSAPRICGALLLFLSIASIGVLPPMIRAGMAIIGTGTWFGIHRKPALLGLFLLSLPVVSSLHFYIGWPLRLAAAEGSVRILELAGVVIARQGVNLEIGGEHIGVDPACGGILMLWHAMAAAMTLAALHHASWKTTIISAGLAFLLAVPANILRTTWLVIEESGRVQPSGISHSKIGLICFIVVLLPLWWWNSRQPRLVETVRIQTHAGSSAKLILILAAIITPWTMSGPRRQAFHAPSANPPLDFTFNGVTLPLIPLSHSPGETAFAASFPGESTQHRWGDGAVILHRVNEAARKLHLSQDCLRAAGFETTHSVTVRCSDGTEWSHFTATREDDRLIIHERIVSEQDGSTWTDAPLWYWSALAHPLNGPWRAETVISR